MPVGKVTIFRKLQSLFKGFFTNDYFIAICSGAWFGSTAYALKGTITAHDFYISLLFFCATFIIYNLDRLFGDYWQELQAFLKRPSLKLLPQKTRANLSFQLFFGGLMLWLLTKLSITLILWLSIPFLVSFFYAVPILPSGARPREIPLLKIFLIAFVWAWISVVPAGENLGFTYEKLGMVLARFCLVYAITIPFDLRDVLADTQTSTTTIPLRIGSRKAIITAFVALIIGVMIAGLWSIPDMAAHIAASLAAFACLVAWHQQRPYYFYLLLLDGCILLYALCIVVFKIMGW